MKNAMDIPRYITIVVYPGRDHASFGCNGDLDGCTHRLADHADFYGDDPVASGYIFSADDGKVVARFNGGIDSDGRRRRFCVFCRKTYSLGPNPGDLKRVCPECEKEKWG